MQENNQNLKIFGRLTNSLLSRREFPALALKKASFLDTITEKYLQRSKVINVV